MIFDLILVIKFDIFYFPVLNKLSLNHNRNHTIWPNLNTVCFDYIFQMNYE